MHLVEITGYGSRGEGVARLEGGKAVFIPGAARGDVLEVWLNEDNGRSARAEIVRIVTPSPYRVEPDCPVYQHCGGCDFRHITYEEELWAKLRRINDAISRIGGLPLQIDEILTTGRINGYRNKAIFHNDGTSLGFYAPKSHNLVPIEHCLLLKDELNAALKDLLLSKIPDLPVSEVTLRSGRNGINPPLEEEMDGLIFGVSGFFQINTGAALLLFQKARKYAAMSKDEVLIDLYCGVGALTLFVGRDAGRAIGVESNPTAVEAARENALRNGLKHIEFYAADAATWASATANPDCVIVDPPRKGLLPGVKRNILKMSPKRIVYISCDPATLARDLREFDGYAVKSACAVDMFPRTANVECCCLLERSEECFT